MASPEIIDTTDGLLEVLNSASPTETDTGTVIANVRFPENANCFILDLVLEPDLASRIRDVAASAGRVAIFVPMADISALALRLLPIDGTTTHLVAAGNSAIAMTATWNRPFISQRILTLTDARERENRQVRADFVQVDGNAVVFDDVAVSGNTLAQAIRAVKPGGAMPEGAITALVGMAFESRRTRRAILEAGAKRFDEVVRYSRVNGGKPPVNSVSTIQANDLVRSSLAARYFGNINALDFLQAK